MLCKIGQLKGTFYKSQVFLADRYCISDRSLHDFYVSLCQTKKYLNILTSKHRIILKPKFYLGSPTTSNTHQRKFKNRLSILSYENSCLPYVSIFTDESILHVFVGLFGLY